MLNFTRPASPDTPGYTGPSDIQEAILEVSDDFRRFPRAFPVKPRRSRKNKPESFGPGD